MMISWKAVRYTRSGSRVLAIVGPGTVKSRAWDKSFNLETRKKLEKATDKTDILIYTNALKFDEFIEKVRGSLPPSEK